MYPHAHMTGAWARTPYGPTIPTMPPPPPPPPPLAPPQPPSSTDGNGSFLMSETYHQAPPMPPPMPPKPRATEDMVGLHHLEYFLSHHHQPYPATAGNAGTMSAGPLQMLPLAATATAMTVATNTTTPHHPAAAVMGYYPQQHPQRTSARPPLPLALSRSRAAAHHHGHGHGSGSSLESPVSPTLAGFATPSASATASPAFASVSASPTPLLLAHHLPSPSLSLRSPHLATPTPTPTPAPPSLPYGYPSSAMAASASSSSSSQQQHHHMEAASESPADDGYACKYAGCTQRFPNVQNLQAHMILHAKFVMAKAALECPEPLSDPNSVSQMGELAPPLPPPPSESMYHHHRYDMYPTAQQQQQQQAYHHQQPYVHQHRQEMSAESMSMSPADVVPPANPTTGAAAAAVAEAKSFTCKTCSRNFKRKFDCQRHEKSHNNEKPHVCVCCHKRWSRREGLVKHQRDVPACAAASQARHNSSGSCDSVPVPPSVTSTPHPAQMFTAAAAAGADTAGSIHATTPPTSAHGSGAPQPPLSLLTSSRPRPLPQPLVRIASCDSIEAPLPSPLSSPGVLPHGSSSALGTSSGLRLVMPPPPFPLPPVAPSSHSNRHPAMMMMSSPVEREGAPEPTNGMRAAAVAHKRRRLDGPTTPVTVASPMSFASPLGASGAATTVRQQANGASSNKITRSVSSPGFSYMPASGSRPASVIQHHQQYQYPQQQQQQQPKMMLMDAVPSLSPDLAGPLAALGMADGLQPASTPPALPSDLSALAQLHSQMTSSSTSAAAPGGKPDSDMALPPLPSSSRTTNSFSGSTTLDLLMEGLGPPPAGSFQEFMDHPMSGSAGGSMLAPRNSRVSYLAPMAFDQRAAAVPIGELQPPPPPQRPPSILSSSLLDFKSTMDDQQQQQQQQQRPQSQPMSEFEADLFGLFMAP
ncbi:hypothetical protein BC828DRAFT_166159 [Blastocladiella britannica]|nr:hypothetical protein BC828DRAFT_166159 [Blastocladiella britannica]